MLAQISKLIIKIGANLALINTIDSRLSRSVVSDNARDLLLKLSEFSENYYNKISIEIDKKKYQNAVADTKLVELKAYVMEEFKKKNKEFENHSYDNTECKFCKREAVSYSAGKGVHALRADCRICRRWWWVGKDEANILIESEVLQSLTNSNGKQLNLFGGVDHE